MSSKTTSLKNKGPVYENLSFLREEKVSILSWSNSKHLILDISWFLHKMITFT